MLNVCFTRSTWSMLKHFMSRVGQREDVVYCPDYLPCGDIATVDVSSRKFVLSSWKMPVEDRFEIEYLRFFKEVRCADSLRIWCAHSPHEQMGAWLTCSLARTREVIVCNPPEEWCLACLEDMDPAYLPLLWSTFSSIRVDEAQASWAYISGVQQQISLVHAKGESVRPENFSYFDHDIRESGSSEPVEAAIHADIAYRKRTGVAFSFEFIYARSQNLLGSFSAGKEACRD